MTIEAWNIVLNAVVAVVLVVYGLWLRNIVNQQLKSKDTTIDALDAVIKIKDAEISALKSDTAPAITKAYADMREHADRMTAEVYDQTRRANELTEELQRSRGEVGKLADENHRQTLIAEATALSSEAKGLLLASALFKELENEPIDSKKFHELFLNATERVLDEAEDRLTQGDRILKQIPHR